MSEMKPAADVARAFVDNTSTIEDGETLAKIVAALVERSRAEGMEAAATFCEGQGWGATARHIRRRSDPAPASEEPKPLSESDCAKLKEPPQPGRMSDDRLEAARQLVAGNVPLLTIVGRALISHIDAQAAKLVDREELIARKDAVRATLLQAVADAKAQIERLTDRLNNVRANRRKWVQAMGLVSALDPSSQVDVANPMEMARSILAAVEDRSTTVHGEPVKITGEGMTIGFDPASGRDESVITTAERPGIGGLGMSFAGAYCCMLEGKRARRPRWLDGCFIRCDGGRFYVWADNDPQGGWTPTDHTDILATDWIIVGEKPEQAAEVGTGMNYRAALAVMKDGMTVRRPSWGRNRWICMRDGKVMLQSAIYWGIWNPTNGDGEGDTEATDWQILEEVPHE